MVSLDSLSARQIVTGVSKGEFSATEVARAALDAISVRDGEVGAFLQVSGDLALAAAARVDAARRAGEEMPPLAGVPVAFKDNMNLLGTRTTCASRMLASYQSAYTATCVQRMLDAGATPLGKLNMDEFAFGSTTDSSAFHPTNNPWDTARVPGGSSGGSAAAVSAGELTLALGSDTGGSIRQPASLCGVVGLKPTYGMVSRYGVVAFGSSLDQVGPFGRRVEDVALAMNALVAGGRDPHDTTSQACEQDFLACLDEGCEGRAIGVIPALLEAEGLSDEVRAAMRQAEERLVGAGARIVEVELPNMASAIAAYYVLGPCEAFSNLARYDGVRFGYQEDGCATLAEQSALSRAHGFGAEAKRRQLLGAYLLSSEMYESYYLAAQKVRTLITADYQRAFAHVDALLMPTSPTVAWEHGAISDPAQLYLADIFTISSNIVGNCGISVPVCLGADSGLPIGAQLQGPAFADARLLALARALERSCGMEGLVAPAFAGRGGELG
ncbi:MAG: Asp-tRNA(Asn)/Glu-tRNA(Gln) amidotransferase subunit GatA [Atopobiaceae bacterium]|nr:Asp-tRNA(Asn)/Glu-tRNA(Gln) amidotransferase subunit GatA [Atopobiaceae bacterium]